MRYTISEKLKDREKERAELENIAAAYHATGLYDKAIEHYEKVLKLKKDEKMKATFYYMMADVYFKKENFDRTLECFNESANLFRKIGDYENLAIIFADMARKHTSLGNYEIAESYCLEALANTRKSGAKEVEAPISLLLSQLPSQRFPYN